MTLLEATTALDQQYGYGDNRPKYIIGIDHDTISAIVIYAEYNPPVDAPKEYGGYKIRYQAK